ncbi:MAG: hypothetical protein AB1630_11205 [bacterium]
MVEEIKEIKEKHQGMWLAIKVTERDKYNKPIKGEILASARTHHELHIELEDPNVYETYAGELPVKAVLF